MDGVVLMPRKVRGKTKVTFSVFNDFRIVSFHYGDTRVGGAQINADNSKTDAFNKENLTRSSSSSAARASGT
jgi:hypothetical protein